MNRFVMNQYVDLKKVLGALTLCLIAFLATADAADAKKKKKKKAERGEIFGTITNEAGEKLADVLVTVTSVENPEVHLKGESDKEGMVTFEIEDPSGAYKVRFEGVGYAEFETEMTLNSGDRQEFTIALLDAAAGQRQDALRLYNEGVEAFNEKDLDASRKKFEASLELAPDLPQAHLGLANVATEQKDWATAASAAETFLAGAPDDRTALTISYVAHRELGDEERMLELREILGKTDLAPTLAIQAYNEGVVALQGGDSEGAIAKFVDAKDLHPEMTQVYPTLATLFYNAARYDEAMEMVEKLAELDPSNPQGHRVRFLVHDARDEQEAASAAIDSYFGADPKGAAEVLYQRADLDFRDGNIDAAKRNLERILAADPEMARAHYTMGLVHMQIDPAKAKEHLQKFIELAPDDPEVPAAQEMLSYI